MASWHPDCYQRAVAFVTDPNGRLLVFDHVDVDAGTQVPAGGIHEEESPADAVRRELGEESGLEDAVIVRKLGEAWNRSKPGAVPDGLEEQIHHVFHLALPRETTVDAWRWDEISRDEISEDEVVQHRFAFRWVSLDEAGDVLWPHQSMWLNALHASLATTAAD